MDFKNSIEKYKSVYYHFLDGLIGSGGGSNIDLVTTTLKDLTPGVLPKEITLKLTLKNINDPIPNLYMI